MNRMKWKNLIYYILLIELAFVFIYPLIYMFVYSFRTQQELLDLNVKWILHGVNLQNYVDAYQELHYLPSLKISILVVVMCTIGHVLSCSLIAYGLTRFQYVGRYVVFVGVILTILIPMQILQIPLYIQYAKMGWIGTVLPMIIPSFFGGGLRGGLFIFIYMQSFRGVPKAYEDAAKIDGCSSLGIFYKILMPICSRATVVVVTLSVIWHWNDIFESRAYLNGASKTLMQRLAMFPTYMYENMTADGSTISLAAFAACILVLLPLLIFLLLIQKKFIYSAQETGMAN